MPKSAEERSQTVLTVLEASSPSVKDWQAGKVPLTGKNAFKVRQDLRRAIDKGRHSYDIDWVMMLFDVYLESLPAMVEAKRCQRQPLIQTLNEIIWLLVTLVAMVILVLIFMLLLLAAALLLFVTQLVLSSVRIISDNSLFWWPSHHSEVEIKLANAVCELAVATGLGRNQHWKTSGVLFAWIIFFAWVRGRDVVLRACMRLTERLEVRFGLH